MSHGYVLILMLSVKFPVKGVMGRVMPSLEQLSDEDGGCRMRLSGWGAVCVSVLLVTQETAVDLTAISGALGPQ